MMPITKETIKKFLQKLQKQGDTSYLILKKLIIVDKFLTWAYQKNLIEADVFKQIKEEIDNIKSKIEDKKLKEETILITESPKFIPQIADLEKAAYAGEKKTEGIFGEISLRFHLQTYKIKSFLFGLLKKVPLLDSRFPFNKKEELKEKKAPSGFDFSNFGIHHYIGFLFFLIFLGFLGAGLYNHFFLKVERPLAYPINLTRGGRALSFQGRLTDSLGNPITTATNVQFKLYNVSTGGTPLYTAGPCSITPDQDGIFSTLIGQSCGSEIPNSVFTENPNVYLGVTVGADSEMTPRQPIANVGYAINAETLQGFPPGQGKSSIPFINKDGNLLIAVASPGIRSTFTSADFTLSSAKTAIIQSAGSGDVVLQATESGALRFRTGGNNDTYTRMIINNNGNVGIGTTNPSTFKLQVDGNVGPNPGGSYNLGSSTYPWANLYASNIYLSGFTPGSVIFAGASGLLSQNNSQFFWDNTNSRLGIGTNSFTAGDPSLKLEIAGNIYVDKLIDRNNTSYGIDPAGNTLLGNYSLYTAYGAILAGASGNVGIGTTNPSTFKLQVDGNVGPNPGGSYNLGSSTYPWANLYASNIYLSGFTPGSVIFAGASGLLSQNNSQFFWDNTNSRLGIGTNSFTAGDPSLKLEIAGNIYVDKLIDRNNTSYGIDPAGNTLLGNYSLYTAYGAILAGASGNVGIGTTSPNQTLSVAGTLGILEGGASPQYYTIFQGGDQSANITYTLPTSIVANGFLRTDASGVLSWTTTIPATSVSWSNLTDPTANLSLNHSTYTTTFNWSTGTGTNNLFSLTTDASANGTGSLLNIQTGTSSTVNPLQVRAGSTEALFVNSSGNVGIGTTGPTEKLQVNGNIYSLKYGSKFIQESTTANSNYSETILTHWGQGAQWAINAAYTDIGYPPSNMIYKVDPGTHNTGAGLFRFDGNVKTWQFYVAPTSTGAGNPVSFTQLSNLSGSSIWFSPTGTISDFYINSSGNVGIGTTSPNQTLSVAGTLGILEGGASPQYYTIFQGGDQSANITYTLPTSIVANGFLRTDASGVLSWTTTIPATSVSWSNLTDPTANLSLNHSTYTTTFNWSTGTGTNNLFSLTTDASANGTGSLLNIQTGTSSTVNPLQVRAGSTEALFVNSSGNVGIGTSAPETKLHVEGQSIFHFDDWGNDAIIIRGQKSGAPNNWGEYAIRPNYSGIQFRNTQSGVTMLFMGQNGNVGIGTTGPGYKLHVMGDIYANGGWLRTSGSAGWYSESYGGGWYMSDTSWIRTYNSKSVWTDSGLLGNNGGLTIGYGGASPPFGGAIIAGNVGIGTMWPWAKLAIEQSGGNSGIGIHRPGVSAGGVATGLQNTAGISLFSNWWGGFSGEPIRFGWAPWNGDWNNFTEVMRIHTNGNVGIGTMSPLHNFQVYRTSLVNPSLTFSEGATAGIRTENIDIAFGAYTSHPWAAWIQARHTSNQAWPLVINPLGGNVGIGTTNPSTFKLEVAGSVGPSADNTYDLGSSSRRWANIYGTNIYGNITPTGFTQGSVIFAGPGGTLSQNNSQFFWDNTNYRLGIGTSTFTNDSKLEVDGVIYADKLVDRNATYYGIDPGSNGINGFSLYTLAGAVLASVSGNVGIGATSPNAKLHIQADGTPASDWNTAQLRISGSTNTNYRLNIGYDTTSNLGVIQAGEHGVVYRNLALNPAGGNVGIGTTTPSHRLHVEGNAFVTGNVGNWNSFTVGGTSANYYPVQFRNDAPGTSVSNDLMIYRSNVHTNGSWFGTFFFKLSFHSTNWGNFGSQIEKIEYLTGNGSPYNDPVGDVADGAAAGGGKDVIIWLRGGATYEWRTLNGGGWTLLNGNSAGGNITDSSGIVRTPISSQSTLITKAKNRFYTNTLSLGTDGTLAVDGIGNSYILGNVGIGTSAPETKLHVEGQSIFHFDDWGNDAIIIRGQKSGAPNNWGEYAIRPNYSGIQFRNTQSGVTMLFMGQNGNVGIGTTGPGYKLHVMGDIYANGGWLRTSGSAGWYSESYGGGWYMSDTSWIRTYNSKSVWTDSGLLGNNGGLTIGYGGASPPFGGAIIAGNVGIGTMWPWAKLAIEQSGGNSGIGIHRPGVSAGGVATGLQNTAGISLFSNWWGGFSGEPIRFGWAPWNGDWNNFTEVMRIHTNGNVGIGTMSPLHNFQVYRTSLVNPSLTFSEGATAGIRTENIDIAFGAYTSHPWAAWIQARHTSNQAWPLVINPLGGNVGIGTTGPSQKLHVAGKLQVGNDANPPTAGAIRWTGTNFEGFNGLVWKTLDVQATSGGGWTEDAAYNRVYLTNSGRNVGIGTTSPQSKLSIGTSGYSDYAVSVNTGSSIGVYSFGNNYGVYGSGGNIGVHGSGSTGVYGSGSSIGVYSFGNNYGVYGSGGNIGVHGSGSTGVYGSGGNIGVHGSGGTYDFYADNTYGKSYFAGNVGIGTTNPGTYKLYVNGAAYSTGGWQGSDIKLKNIVSYLSEINILDKIKNLDPIIFTWKKDEFPNKGLPDGRHIGFIAQQLQQEFPEIINYDDEGYLAVDYSAISAINLAAIKKQQLQIASQSARLSLLEKDLNLTSTGDVKIVRTDGNGEYFYNGLDYENQNSNLKTQNYSLKLKTGELIERIGAFAEIAAAKIKTGLLEAENAVVNNVLAAKNIVAENINLTTKNITIAGKTIEQLIDERIETFFNLRLISFNSQKIISPVVEITNLKATGEASLNTISTNEIKPQEKDLVINLNNNVGVGSSNPNNTGENSLPLPNSSYDKGPLARLIIKGLEGKTAVLIDAEGNASFSGTISAKTIQSNQANLSNLNVTKDATISGTLSTNTLNATEASVSGKIIAKEIEAENINEIQRLLAEIKNQPLPDLNNQTNLANTTDLNCREQSCLFATITVTGQSNLYNVSVSGSLLVGQTFVENNSITTLASELKLSALDKITLFDGAVTIAKDGSITTKGEIIAQGGIKTSKITPLEKDLSILGNLSVLGDLKLPKATDSALIAAPDNLAKNGIFAPAIEASASAAGTGTIPKTSQEVIIYSSFAKPTSLIYLTPKTPQPISLSIFEKKDGFFRVIRNELLDQDVAFDWLIIN